jgi:glycosyltransferase involved in cell wall biosynthesis
MRFSNKPLVSVVMATFNRAGYLSGAVESVIAQTFESWELIIVDDGSTDDTPSLVKPYTENHPNIRYLRHSNRKAALSRNAGIQASFGEYITFIDSDDRYLPQHLESRMAIIAANPGVLLLSGGYACEAGTMVRDRHDPEKLINIRECILGGTFFGKRELFLAVEGFRPLDYAEDTDLWERASGRFPVMRIEEPRTYLYQRAEDSITRHFRA